MYFEKCFEECPVSFTVSFHVRHIVPRSQQNHNFCKSAAPVRSTQHLDLTQHRRAHSGTTHLVRQLPLPHRTFRDIILVILQGLLLTDCASSDATVDRLQQAAFLLRPNPTRALCSTQPPAFSSVHCASTTKRTSHRRTATTMALTVTR